MKKSRLCCRKKKEKVYEKRYEKILSSILCITCCGLLASCNDTSSHIDSSSVVNENESTASSPVLKMSEKILAQEEIKVCFIGNSLIDYGLQSSYLDDIAMSYGRNLKVDKITWGGSWLSDYLDGSLLPKKEVKKRLGQAEIVVFQDYGGWQGNTTTNAIKKLKRWCKDNASLYYYMYEEDNLEMEASDYKKLDKLGLDLIPKGQLIDAMYEMGYTYEELHLEADIHPNTFNGYISALVMHNALFDEKCVDFPKEWFSGENAQELSNSLDDIKESLHGESEEEDWEELLKICAKADELVEQVAGKEYILEKAGVRIALPQSETWIQDIEILDYGKNEPVGGVSYHDGIVDTDVTLLFWKKTDKDITYAPAFKKISTHEKAWSIVTGNQETFITICNVVDVGENAGTEIVTLDWEYEGVHFYMYTPMINGGDYSSLAKAASYVTQQWYEFMES